jgi:1-deoxy-D-xylulose-5-phosphate synthase
MAAGMARAGMRPVCAIYSTFLQRAFDQAFQEVSLQELPVIFCMDRAGLVGSDGAVHHGFLDIAYLRGLPGMVLMAPGDEPEILAALRLATSIQQPCGIRYPRDNVPDALAVECPPFEMGKSRLLRDGPDAAILAYGATCSYALAAADELARDGIRARVVNARFAKPIDGDMVRAALDGRPVVTVEDHSVTAGFGSAVLETAQELGLPIERLVRLGMPADRFIAHGSRAGQLAECGIDAAGIAAAVRRAIEARAHDHTTAGANGSGRLALSK